MLKLDIKKAYDRVIKSCLDKFCEGSGQKVNFVKSKINLSSNVDSFLVLEISGLANIPCTKDIGTYLGLLLINGRKAYVSFQYLLDKLNKKSSGWKIDTLPFAGRVTLTKHVLNSTPFIPCK